MLSQFITRNKQILTLTLLVRSGIFFFKINSNTKKFYTANIFLTLSTTNNLQHTKTKTPETQRQLEK